MRPITFLSTLHLSWNEAHLAYLAITFYDWLLMMRREIDNVWRIRPRLRAGTIIYFVNRYFMLVSVVLLLAGTTVSVSLEVSNPPSAHLPKCAGSEFIAGVCHVYRCFYDILRTNYRTMIRCRAIKSTTGVLLACVRFSQGRT